MYISVAWNTGCSSKKNPLSQVNNDTEVAHFGFGIYDEVFNFYIMYYVDVKDELWPREPYKVLFYFLVKMASATIMTEALM